MHQFPSNLCLTKFHVRSKSKVKQDLKFFYSFLSLNISKSQELKTEQWELLKFGLTIMIRLELCLYLLLFLIICIESISGYCNTVCM